MKCPTCGEEGKHFGEFTTLVGYYSPPGHNHDDNCVKRRYSCINNHLWIESKINKCSHPDCDWEGKKECFCHDGPKVSEWTDK